MQTIRQDGLRILTKNIPYTKRANLVLMARSGSADDPAGRSGLFHFFEHMAFQGTPTRTKNDITSLFERYAFSHNASTAKLYTQYYAHSVREHLPVLMDLLSDMFFNLSFPESELAKEKEVIKHEIERFWDEDMNRLHMGVLGLMYGSDHPLARFGAGSVADVAATTRDDLLNVRDQYYVPANAYLIATGDVDHAEVCQLADKYIPIKDKKVEYKDWTTESDIVPAQKEFILERPQREKATLTYDAKLETVSDKDNPALSIFMRMLAKGMDSIFFKEIREKRGWAYSVSGGWGGQKLLGESVGFTVGTSPDKIADLRKLLPELIFNFLLDEKHFQRVKSKYVDSVIVGMEDAHDWESLFVGLINRAEFDDLADVEAVVKRDDDYLAAVTFEDVKKMRDLIRPEHFVTGLLLPKK